jgi:hypothetical protein
LVRMSQQSMMVSTNEMMIFLLKMVMEQGELKIKIFSNASIVCNES